MTVTVSQVNQSRLGTMCRAQLLKMKEKANPKFLLVLELLQAVLENQMETLPGPLRKHRSQLQELLAEMSRMEPEDVLALLIPKEPDVSPLQAANQLAEELQTRPESLPAILLENLLNRDV